MKTKAQRRMSGLWAKGHFIAGVHSHKSFFSGPQLSTRPHNDRCNCLKCGYGFQFTHPGIYAA